MTEETNKQSRVFSEPLELEAGKTYVIQIDENLSARAIESIQQVIAREAERIGCKFLLLDKGMRIAQQETVVDKEAIIAEACKRSLDMFRTELQHQIASLQLTGMLF